MTLFCFYRGHIPTGINSIPVLIHIFFLINCWVTLLAQHLEILSWKVYQKGTNLWKHSLTQNFFWIVCCCFVCIIKHESNPNKGGYLSYVLYYIMNSTKAGTRSYKNWLSSGTLLTLKNQAWWQMPMILALALEILKWDTII